MNRVKTSTEEWTVRPHLAAAAKGREVAAAPSYWALALTDLLRALDAPAAGLSSAGAQARLRRTGRLAAHRHRTELVLLLRQFATPITLILVFATVASAVLGEVTDAAIILAIVLLSGLLSFWQEYGASRAVEDLLATVQVTAEVWRDGRRVFVPAHDVVPGDVVVLDTGDLVPGDCRILEAHDLLVDEAPLTGESFPVEKGQGVLPAETPLAGRANCLFQGTHVVRGAATAVVAHTGAATEFGRVAQQLQQRQPATRFERGLTQFGRLLLWVMVVIVVLICGANILLARPVVDSLLFSVALAVGLTPQLLPAIVSVSLSLGARQMARSKVIVKRLSAIEDFGDMDVLCTDKTGTLTQGSVRLAGALDCDGHRSAAVLRAAYLNALHHTGFGNPIDDAILAAPHVETAGTARLGELPYDFERRRLSVLVAIDGERVLLTKGAVESVLAVCQAADRGDGSAAPLVQVQPDVRGRFEALSAQGYRVLGVARKTLGPVECEAPLGLADETGMTFLGFLTFRDPPKPGIGRTLRELAALGVSLRMVTGDNRFAAAHAARTVGLDARRILTGADLLRVPAAELAARVGDVAVFAEVDPVQKAQIIRALQRAGRDVGFLGDGINDAPALHAADVGISVDTAVDVAKDAAGIVLLEKDLDVLIQGVRLGRRTFANTLKYIFVTTSANFGNMASMAAATLFLPFLPLLPFQILLINFLTDLPGTTIATDAADSEQLARPGTWDLRFIRNFMVVFGLISSAFDVLTFGVLRLAFGANEALFRSGWFVESVATELAVMLVLRTRRRFFRSRPGTALLVSSAVVAVATLAILYGPLAAPLAFVPPPAAVLFALAAITGGYILITEVAKAVFYRRPRPDSRPAARPVRP
jgi:Mg2+-importing ATPase